MLRFEINNFCDRTHVEVKTMPEKYSIPAGVQIEQMAGGMYFHHNMTPRQAREMAEALIECAAEADALAAMTAVMEAV